MIKMIQNRKICTQMPTASLTSTTTFLVDRKTSAVPPELAANVKSFFSFDLGCVYDFNQCTLVNPYDYSILQNRKVMLAAS